MSLDDRKAAILRAVVREYIETAQPVGSAHVSRGGLGVSPATVRNEMALLERDGYLTQPHTSAGRVPTDKGYRFFVDQLTTPASRVAEDSSCETLAIRSVEVSRLASTWRRISALIASSSGRSCSSVSTKKR